MQDGCTLHTPPSRNVERKDPGNKAGTGMDRNATRIPTYLELLYFKPEMYIAFERVSFHGYVSCKLATVVGIKKSLTQCNHVTRGRNPSAIQNLQQANKLVFLKMNSIRIPKRLKKFPNDCYLNKGQMQPK